MNFNQIPTDPEPFAATVRAAMAACRANRDAFCAFSGDTPAPEVVQAFDRIAMPLGGLEGRVGLFTQTHPDQGMRESCERLEREIAELSTEFSLDRSLFDRLNAVEAGALEGTEFDDERRHLEHSIRDFRRSGVDRDEDSRIRIRALKEELVQIGQDFDRNTITGGKTYTVADGHAGLEGLPEDFLATHPEKEDGTVVLSTDPTERMAVMTYAERDDVRRGFHVACLNRAVPENLEVLPRLLEKRHELATLLGYTNWADYVTEDKMVKSSDDVRAFLDRVVGLASARADREQAEKLEFKQRRDQDAGVIEEWEAGYLTEKLRAEKFGFDSQSVRPYFSYAKVKEGVLSTSAALYGVEFVRDDDAPTWHQSVECYTVVADGEPMARFFLDMHPRDEKFKHAAMFHLTEGVKGVAMPEAALVCNFPEPSDDDPALMQHDQVTTYFHEFGHLLHHLFGGAQRFLRFSGISTEWDFVEAPSQMYEEWAWDAKVLASFAHHNETGAPIPVALVEQMRAAEEYGKGLRVLQQMLYATLALTYYDRDPAGIDTTAVMIELKQKMSPAPHVDGTFFQAAFGHLHGYSAMYYTYMWSLVLSKDLYSRFTDGPMDLETAAAYRREVLEPGGSRDAADLVRAFLGRDASFDAFKAWLAA